MKPDRLLLLFLLFLSLTLARADDGVKPPEAPKGDAMCLDCHSDPALGTIREGKKVSLFADQKTLMKSAHSSLACVDCHDKLDPDKQPHAASSMKVDCSGCHEKLGPSHKFHPRLGASPMPLGEDTSCTMCHGMHDIASRKSPDFPFTGTKEMDLCGKCHKDAKASFLSSAHAQNPGSKEKAPTPDCIGCHRETISDKSKATMTAEMKLAQVRLCESCHVHNQAVTNRTVMGDRFVSSFEKSVHGAALARGDANAASCVDCHGSHDMNKAMVANSKVNPLQVSTTCARCHSASAKQYDSSVHAMALKKGNTDSPICTRCHGEHDIRSHTDPKSPIHAKNVSQQVCASCHGSLRLTTKYGMSSDRFQTFSDSFHGLAVRGGSVEVVNCGSCHGAHAILSDKDPDSSVSKAKLVDTCGRCHPGANTRFTVGAVHVSPDQPGQEPILYWISNLYVALITLVVGGMFLHNILDFFKKARRKLAIHKGLVEEEPVAHRLYLRMTLNERLQHATMVLSFVALVVTGFGLRYPEAWWVQGIRHISDRAFEWRGFIHRAAGVMMVVAGVWHVAYLAFSAKGRQLFLDLLPRWRDVTDPWKVLRYNLGLSPTKPLFPRFSYIEKAEYWALIWGSVIMALTGAILWFDNTSMGLLGKLGFDVGRSIHYYEAILATLAIIVWHFYFVLFNPDIYPMNLAWFTGHMSEREMLEEHPLELERLKALEAKTETKKDEPGGHGEKPKSD